MSTGIYWFAPDGDDEPTMWRETRISYEQSPLAVMRRCDNPEVFDFLKGLLATSGTAYGDPFLSPRQTNPNVGTPEDAAAQLDMARDLDRALKARGDEGEA